MTRLKVTNCDVCGNNLPIRRRLTCSKKCAIERNKNLRRYINFSKYDKNYYWKNRMSRLKSSKEYSTKSMKIFYNHNSNARRKGIKPFSKDDIQKIMEKIVSGCSICGLVDEDVLQVHHIKPIKEGGQNIPENCMWLCANCHIRHHINEGRRRI